MTDDWTGCIRIFFHCSADSEAEDEASRVVLSDRFVGKGNGAAQQVI